MKRYAFNGFLFSQRQTGVMRYAREILLELDKICMKDEFELVVPTYADSYPKLNNIKLVLYGSIRGNLWEQISFFRYIKTNKLEAVNFNNTCPILSPGIVVIHDIAYQIHPEFGVSLHGKISNLYHRLIYFIVSKLNGYIITVSHFSKYQLIDTYKIKPTRIKVISAAWQHFCNVKEDDSIVKEKKLQRGEYYFSLGSLSIMKNTKWIYEVAKKNSNDIFVVTGAISKNGYNIEDIPHNVVLTGYVTDEQIISLIRNCKAFIYPSLYDGFGIPPLEALSQKIKVICSNAACLPEIYQGSVHYIDPYETEVDLNNILKEKIDLPENTLNRYSWHESALKWYALLKRRTD